LRIAITDATDELIMRSPTVEETKTMSDVIINKIKGIMDVVIGKEVSEVKAILFNI